MCSKPLSLSVAFNLEFSSVQAFGLRIGQTKDRMTPINQNPNSQPHLLQIKSPLRKKIIYKYILYSQLCLQRGRDLRPGSDKIVAVF